MIATAADSSAIADGASSGAPLLALCDGDLVALGSSSSGDEPVEADPPGPKAKPAPKKRRRVVAPPAPKTPDAEELRPMGRSSSDEDDVEIVAPPPSRAVVAEPVQYLRPWWGVVDSLPSARRNASEYSNRYGHTRSQAGRNFHRSDRSHIPDWHHGCRRV